MTMSTFQTIIIVGEQGTAGFGAKVNFDFSVDGLSNDEILDHILARTPDAYAAGMPDGTLWEIGIGARRSPNTNQIIVADWVAIWDKLVFVEEIDSLATARRKVIESRQNQRRIESFRQDL